PDRKAARPGRQSAGRSPHSRTGDVMDIRFWCARCGQVHFAPGEHVGKRRRCRACGHVPRIPEPASPAPDSGVYALAEVPTPPPPLPRRADPLRAPGGRRKSWADGIRAYTEEASRLQGLSICLVILSAADLFMTFTLLRTSSRFFESNPVALWFFQRW